MCVYVPFGSCFTEYLLLLALCWSYSAICDCHMDHDTTTRCTKHTTAMAIIHLTSQTYVCATELWLRIGCVNDERRPHFPSAISFFCRWTRSPRRTIFHSLLLCIIIFFDFYFHNNFVEFSRSASACHARITNFWWIRMNQSMWHKWFAGGKQIKQIPKNHKLTSKRSNCTRTDDDDTRTAC